MVLLNTFQFKLRLAGSGTEFEFFKDSTVSSGETGVPLSRIHGGNTGGALVACRWGLFGTFSTSR
jgi:hypothetical protein